MVVHTLYSTVYTCAVAYRRRINTEEKAKVVAAVWGIEFIFILKVSILYVVSLSIIKIFYFFLVFM